MILKTIKGLDKRETYTKVFEFLNIIQEDTAKRLTPREMRFLIEFMLLPEDEYPSYLRFGRKAKFKVLDIVNTTFNRKFSKAHLYETIGALKKKSIIYKEDDGIYRISPFIEKYILNKSTVEFGLKLEDIGNAE